MKTRKQFDAVIGKLDRCLSEFLDLFSGDIDEPDRQTLKHHADDLIGVGGAMLEKIRQDGELRGSYTVPPNAHCSKDTPPILKGAGPQMEHYTDWGSWYFARQVWVAEMRKKESQR
jgi:hypothetical protein